MDHQGRPLAPGVVDPVALLHSVAAEDRELIINRALQGEPSAQQRVVPVHAEYQSAPPHAWQQPPHSPMQVSSDPPPSPAASLSHLSES